MGKTQRHCTPSTYQTCLYYSSNQKDRTRKNHYYLLLAPYLQVLPNERHEQHESLNNTDTLARTQPASQPRNKTQIQFEIPSIPINQHCSPHYIYIKTNNIYHKANQENKKHSGRTIIKPPCHCQNTI